jgi:phosphoglycerol transferase MdoB-like AlkP superfamily enzyme
MVLEQDCQIIVTFGVLTQKKETENPYAYYVDDRYEQRLTELYVGNDSFRSVIYTTRFNIILVILESFTAKVIKPLGGEPGVTPAFNELAKEGVLFSNIYSTDS